MDKLRERQGGKQNQRRRYMSICMLQGGVKDVIINYTQCFYHYFFCHHYDDLYGINKELSFKYIRRT